MHDERLRAKHERLKRAKTKRVQERLRARQALSQSKVLKKLSMFADQSDASLAKVVEAMEMRFFNPGDSLVVQGERGSEFMVLMRGEATVLVDGREVRRFGALDYFGEGALLQSGHARGATVMADAQAQVLATREEVTAKVHGILAKLAGEQGRRRLVSAGGGIEYDESGQPVG